MSNEIVTEERDVRSHNINKQKTKEITPSDEDVSAHKEMLKKIKNPIWNKFNY